VPQLQLWNAWRAGERLRFELVLPGWDAPVRTREGAWVEAAAAALGVRARGAARLRPARFTYPGDYLDPADWRDRWPRVTLVELDVEPCGPALAASQPPFVDLWAEDDDMIDVAGDDAGEGEGGAHTAHDQAALLVVDFPADRSPSAAWLQAVAGLGTTEERVFKGPAVYTQLQPIRQVRVVAEARFPADVPGLEALLDEARASGGCCDWRRTFHPDHL
jgi:hypothetical protein